MVHDFAITERNVVFLDLPVVFDFDLVGKRPFPAAWTPDYGARVGVMPRDGGNADVRWFDVELCYVFHSLNAYDLPDGSEWFTIADAFIAQGYYNQESDPQLDIYACMGITSVAGTTMTGAGTSRFVLGR